MKILATILVLAFVSAGGKAQDELVAANPVNWEDTLERFWALADQVTRSTQNAVPKEVLESQLGELITDALSQLNETSRQLQSRLGPLSEQFQADAEVLSDRLRQDLNTAKSSVEIYNDEVRMMVRQNLADVRSSLAMYLRKFHKRVSRNQEAIKRRFREYQETLENQGQRAAEGLREAMDPVAREAGGRLRERLAAVHDDLKRRVGQAQEQARSLQEQTAISGQELRRAVEEKVETIQRWFEVESQKIAGRFQEWIDSVRVEPAEGN